MRSYLALLLRAALRPEKQVSFKQFDTIVYRNSVATNYNSMNDHEDIREVTGVCDTIDSLAITAAPESTGVTTFVQEACTAVSAVDSDYSMTHFPVQADLQDVREYFRRPVCIRAASCPGGRGRFYGVNYTFSELIGLWDNGVNRLKGAYGIRAKVVLTLQVSATPFHQGLVVLSAQYGYNALPGVYNRTTDSATATNLPHVVLDLSSDTSVQLHLPFLAVGEYCAIRGATQEAKYVYISLNTLTTVPSIAGMGVPTYQVYMHFEDIQLFGATPQNVTNVVLTSGRKLNPVLEEFERDSHPFSSALHATGKAIGFLAKGVPSLSTIGGPVAWAIGKAAGVVRYFGYGKPAVTDPLMRVVRQTAVGEFNTDVATSCMVVAATASNTTSINTTVGASDVDEMALKYVTSRWAQVCVFDYTTTSTAGTRLYACPINMLALWFRAPTSLPAANVLAPRASTATSNSIQPSHLMFAASSFKQWRGGLKFRFTFAKTKMHAGRVMVAFNPDFITLQNTDTLDSATLANIPVYGSAGADPYGYSAIFDLKDGNVFEFKVPYVCPAPYANLAATLGGLVMYVVNPLIASSVVSTAISVVVQVAGDVDFELANPAGHMYAVHNAGTIALQAGRVLSEAPEIINQLTMGEVITSVKQLISIPGVAGFGPNMVVTTGEVIPPWFYQPTPSVLVPAATNQLVARSFHYGGNWASCYSFLKGGTDVHVYNTSKDSMLIISQLPGPGGYLTTDVTADQRSSSNAPVLVSFEHVSHARLPGFFPTGRAHAWVANTLTSPGSQWIGNNPFSSTTSVTPFDGLQAVYTLRVAPNSVSTYNPAVLVNTNASDDAQLAMYIGPPPVFLPPTPVTGPGVWDLDSENIQNIT